MKLYVVDVSFDMVVLANSEDEAALTARDYADEEMGNQSDIISGVFPITRERELPSRWRAGLPYPADSISREDRNRDLTVAQWFAALAAKQSEKPTEGVAAPLLEGAEPEGAGPSVKGESK